MKKSMSGTCTSILVGCCCCFVFLTSNNLPLKITGSLLHSWSTQSQTLSLLCRSKKNSRKHKGWSKCTTVKTLKYVKSGIWLDICTQQNFGPFFLFVWFFCSFVQLFNLKCSCHSECFTCHFSHFSHKSLNPN